MDNLQSLNDYPLLDNNANNASLPIKLLSLDSVIDKAKHKQKRHFLRNTAGSIMTRERVAICGRKSIGNYVSIHCHQQQASFGAVETCSSVWMCPVCAAKITEGRRIELDDILKKHSGLNGRSAMITLTIPHHKFQKCRILKVAVANAWRKIKAGKGWQVTRDKSLWIGDIRAIEVTHGENGWHPHLHILVFFEETATDSQIYNYGEWVYERWAKAIHAMNLGDCNIGAYKFEIIKNDMGVADYIGKWGAAMELTKGHIKQSKGGRTPWQILQDYQTNGKPDDKILFLDYAISFKGTRQLTWSREFTRRNGKIIPSIRERYNQLETTDEDLCAIPDMIETHTATITKDLFKTIVKHNLTAAILSGQEEGGIDRILEILISNKIRFKLSEIHSLKQGDFVPLLEAERGI